MSKELTDDFLNKKLQAGSFYFVETENGHFEPMVVDMDGDFNDYEGNYYKPEFSKGKLEVLSPCDYNTLVHLETKAEWQAERIKELEQDVKTLTNNYKLLEDKQASDIIHGQALVDEFGDFEALYEELKNLRFLLKECDGCVRSLRARGVSDCNGSNLNDLLTRITTAIGESEEK